MERSKKWKWLLLSVALIAVAAAVWSSTLPAAEEEDMVYMTQAYAMKAVAVLLTEGAASSQYGVLPEPEPGAPWYMTYGEYLWKQGFWPETELSALWEGPDLTWELLCWKQVRQMTEALAVAGAVGHTTMLPEKAASGAWDDRKVSKQDWWTYFEGLTKALICEEYQILEITVYGTDETVDVEAGLAATSEGLIRYDGFDLQDYIDHTLRVRLLGHSLLDVLEVTDTTVTYRNVWLQGLSRESAEGEILVLEVFMEGLSRRFDAPGMEGDYKDVLADIILENGRLTRVSVKRDRISGKVLAVTPDHIEIQGYGEVPLDEEVRVYRLYEGIQEKTLSSIVVGYSVHEFIVADGKICGALALENIEVENIRVLISNNDFEGSDHDKVSLISDGTMRITIGEETSEWPAGTEFSVTPSSAAFDQGRILVEGEEEIRISSLERRYGVPSYPGTIELSLGEDAIWVVNEVGLEEYLCRVVPSEMPAGHGLEALKTQAVCARSYAYNQIRANACRSKGAHVDDTTTYQVYNNSKTKELCTRAVLETAGRILTYEGETVTAYYSSTTCGSSTNMEIWGGTQEEYPYLVGQMLTTTGEALDLTDEEIFRDFIKDTEYETFDTDFAWYRWNLYADLTTLSDAINTALSELGENESPYVLVQQEDGEFRQAAIRSVGAVTRMEVTARGAGGIVSELLVEGTQATIRVLRQGNVRSYLGHRDHVITKKDGSTVTNMRTIPSAFICLEAVQEGENLAGYQIYGGGYGHGVGMSQNAAKTMAAQGMDCAEILQFFYPGTELTSIYEG